jgi:MTH538 TIR-like domain (DUF1863)
MSNSPFDPDSPLFPWYQAPPPPQQVTPSLAELLAAMQPKPQPKPFDLSMLSDLLPKITIRPRIFASYQHATDQHYYNEFSRVFHDTHECVYDGSLDDEIDSDDHDYIKQRIRDEFIAGTSCTVVLVGPTTYQRKHVDWEIKATLDKEHGLIGVQLPNLPVQWNNTVLVPDRLHSNIKSGYALWLTWQQVIASASGFTQYVTAASNRSKDLIVNPREIKTRNG